MIQPHQHSHCYTMTVILANGAVPVDYPFR